MKISKGRSVQVLVCPNAQLLAIYSLGALPAHPLQTFVYGSYIDEPLLTKKGSGKFYYHRNQQYSITALTDIDGELVERYAYDAHGKTLIMTPAGAMLNESTVDNPFCYTGRFLHAELELMYFRARYYDPNTGEFISRDPMEYVDGMSQYRGFFVPKELDPSGKVTVTRSYFCFGFGVKNCKPTLFSCGGKCKCIYTGNMGAWVFGGVVAGCSGTCCNALCTPTGALGPKSGVSVFGGIAMSSCMSGCVSGAIGSMSLMGGDYTGGALCECTP